MSKSFKPNAGYARSERRGFIFLAVLAAGLLAIPALSGLWKKANAPKTAISTAVSTQDSEGVVAEAAATRAFFDPNSDSETDLVAAGFTEKLASQLVKYRSKGGQFRQTEDLKKMYAMTPELYLVLAPKCRIAQPSTGQHQAYAQKDNYAPRDYPQNSAYTPNSYPKYPTRNDGPVANETTPKNYSQSDSSYSGASKYPTSYAQRPVRVATAIDINAANLADWESLPGIGNFWANKIIKFREALGGFASIQQVAETFNFPDSSYQKIQPLLLLKTGLQPFDLKQITVEELDRHPYISKRQAQAIINARLQHEGQLTKIQIEQLGIFMAQDWKRIQPYLGQ